MTFGEFEEELDREIEMMHGQGRGQHHAGFNHGRRVQNNEEPRLPMPKMDFPKFNGKRPKEWVYKAEQYFICQEIAEQHKIRLAKMYLEEDAMQWYWFWEEDYPNATWDLFKEELLLRFGETSYVNHEIELRNLKQTTTVQDYQSKFEKLSSMVKNRPEESKIAHFIGGLDEDIQIEMLRDPPTELRRCFALAKTIEEQLKRREAKKKAYKRGFSSKPKPNFVKSAPTNKKFENRPAFRNNIPIKYISRQERE
uniref:Retrotransposon gag domain-containing protein n=1 Tax=Nymphaea colorata TaxID=210225 RepID=A0A5K0V1Z5_9MAGN